MTASISARNRSRRVTFPFWLHAIPANVRCSPIPNLPTPSLDVLRFYHSERLAQSFPRGWTEAVRTIGLITQRYLVQIQQCPPCYTGPHTSAHASSPTHQNSAKWGIFGPEGGTPRDAIQSPLATSALLHSPGYF